MVIAREGSRQYLPRMKNRMAGDNGRARSHDITLVGATGFTGTLIAEHLATRTTTRQVRLAYAGRSLSRLEALRSRIVRHTRSSNTPQLIMVDLSDEETVDRLAADTHVVVSAAGPYGRVGSPLVAACARHGTHYLDLAGEVPWIRRMITAHEATALASGACIVHCCGFDSVPSDLGTLVLTDEVLAHSGRPPDAVRLVFGRSEGGFSGGTVASLVDVITQSRSNPAVRDELRDLDSLVTDRPAAVATGGRRASLAPRFDRYLKRWTMPFFMGPINERIVRRSNALRGFPLGGDPDYREVISFGRGPIAAVTAGLAAAAASLFMGLLSFRPTRTMLLATVLPKPGSGPRAAVEGRGSFQVDMHAYLRDETRTRRGLTLTISSELEPGYGATAVMIAEGALLMLERAVHASRPAPGFQTPATALGLSLVARLREAGIRFDVQNREDGERTGL